MSRPCPLPSCTRNPRSCTPSFGCQWNGPGAAGEFIARESRPPPHFSSKREAPLSPRQRTSDRRTGERVLALVDELRTRSRMNSRVYHSNRVDPRRRCLEPAVSWNATRRPDPLTASQKLLLRRHRSAGSPPQPPVHRPGALPRFASAAALLRRLRAGTNHSSSNFVFLLRHGRAGLNVSLDGCSGGLYLDDGVLRGAYLKNREERLSPAVPTFLSLPVSFSYLLS